MIPLGRAQCKSHTLLGSTSSSTLVPVNCKSDSFIGLIRSLNLITATPLDERGVKLLTRVFKNQVNNYIWKNQNNYFYLKQRVTPSLNSYILQRVIMQCFKRPCESQTLSGSSSSLSLENSGNLSFPGSISSSTLIKKVISYQGKTYPLIKFYNPDDNIIDDNFILDFSSYLSLFQDKLPAKEFENYKNKDEQLEFISLFIAEHSGKFAQRAKKYYVYYVNTNRMQEVCRSVFSKLEGAVIDKRTHKIRIIGMLPHAKRQLLFKGEHIFSTLINCLTSFSTLLDKTTSLINSIDKIKVLKLLRFILQFQNLVTTNANLSSVVTLLIDSYLLMNEIDNVFNQESNIEALILAAGSMFLPKKLYDVIQRANTFTNSKLADSYSGLHSLLSSLFDFFQWVLEKINAPEIVMDVFKNIVTSMSVTKPHFLVNQMDKMVIEAKNDTLKVTKPDFRKKGMALDHELSSCVSLLDMVRKSAAIKSIYDKFKRLIVIIKNYENCSRIEPVMFVLEGGPGCGKSLMMDQITQALQGTIYTHITPSNMDAKDFYDDYNNEETYVSDDVGASGISQWRTYVNLVSPIKVPLTCAAAELKNTKFFNSTKIIVTTNRFMGIHSVTAQDCIANLGALHRRGIVICFRGAVLNAQGFVNGTIRLMNYDKSDKTFKNSHHFQFKNHPLLREIPVQVELEGTKASNIRFLQWFFTLLNSYDEINKTNFNSNALSEEEIKAVRLGFQRENQETDYFDYHLTDYLDGDDPSDHEEEPFELVQMRMDAAFSNLLHEMAKEDEIASKPWYKRYISDVLLQSWYKIVNFVVKFQAKQLYSPIIIGASIGVMIYFIKSCYDPTKKQLETKFTSEFSSSLADVKNLHTSKQSLFLSNCVKVKVRGADEPRNVHGTLSGEFLILPAHSVNQQDVVVTAVDSHSNVVLDNKYASVVLRDNEMDCVVLKLLGFQSSPFKSVAKYIKVNHHYLAKDLSLLNSQGFLPLNNLDCNSIKQDGKYVTNFINNTNIRNDFYASRDYFYPVRGEGLCGTLLVDGDNGILGQHVAGSPEKNVGVTIVWSDDFKKRLSLVLRSGFSSKLTVTTPKSEGVSIIQVENINTHGITVPTTSNLKPSPLIGSFLTTREPANLVKFGAGTLHEVSKKSMTQSVYIPTPEILFASQCMEAMLPDFIPPLSEKEVVSGSATKGLARMNKESVNGLGFLPKKEDYLDYENSCYKDSLITELEDFSNLVKEKVYPTKHLQFYATLKDELKEAGKDPRAFCVGTIVHQVKCKEHFGELVAYIQKYRTFNGICVGINPYKDWDSIYHSFDGTQGIWAGDIARWDGKMSPQATQIITKLLVNRVPPDSKAECDVLLSSIGGAYVTIMNRSYVMTHSMPSGCYLTAIFNSMVNRFYTALWYYRNLTLKGIKPSVTGFFTDVIDLVYGDDKLNGVFKHFDVLNALTMKDFFLSLGMDFTTSTKGEIIAPSESWNTITFLKRSFKFHNLIKRIMCPLSMDTLHSSIQYYNEKSDLNVVMRDKVNNYFREIYLHSDREVLKEEFEQILKERGIPYISLSDEYLNKLYTEFVNELPVYDMCVF